MAPPVWTQFVFDGTGELDIEKWRQAVHLASEKNPGARLVLRGKLGMSYWMDSGKTPPVTEVDGSKWTGFHPENIPPCLFNTYDVKKGPTCEVVLVHADPLRVIFRTHHGVMDGRGTFVWAEDICRALRGESILGADSAVTDYELARALGKAARTPFPFDNVNPTGRAQGRIPGVTYFRKWRKGKFHSLLGQAAILAAKEAWKHQDGKVRFAIPVDMRRHLKGVRSTANLTMPIYIEVTRASTPESISQSVTSQLEAHAEGMLDKGDPLINWTPMKLIEHKWRTLATEYHKKGLYRTSGVISNMGAVPPMHIFSGGGFEANHFWPIPPAYDFIPFFLGLASSEGSLEVIVSMPKVLASGGRIEHITSTIIDGLEAATVDNK